LAHEIRSSPEILCPFPRMGSCQTNRHPSPRFLSSIASFVVDLSLPTRLSDKPIVFSVILGLRPKHGLTAFFHPVSLPLQHKSAGSARHHGDPFLSSTVELPLHFSPPLAIPSIGPECSSCLHAAHPSDPPPPPHYPFRLRCTTPVGLEA